MVDPTESLALLILFYGAHGAAFLLGVRAGGRSSPGFAGRGGFVWAVPGLLIAALFIWLLFQVGGAAWWLVFSRFVDFYFAPGLLSLPAFFVMGRWLNARKEDAA